MMLSMMQMRALWVAAGGSPRDADTAAAIGMAESRGNNLAVNNGDPYGGSRCYMQINGVHPFDPYALTREPYLCAMAGVYVRHESGWGAWSTYSDGSYRAFLPHYRAHHAHARHRKAYHVHTVHHIRPMAAVGAPQEAVSYLGACMGIAGLAAVSMQLARAARKALIAAVREEIAVRKRACRRKNYQDAVAYAKRTMPRERRRTALNLA